MKDKEIAKVQQDCIRRKNSFTSAQVFNAAETADKEAETSRKESITSDYIIAGNIASNSSEKLQIQSTDKKPIVKKQLPQKVLTSNNEAKEVTASDLASQPVAPPRRKRKEKKDSAHVRNVLLTVLMLFSNEIKGVNKCIIRGGLCFLLLPIS